jgi:tetratricopeptide (TPR) repeat protein
MAIAERIGDRQAGAHAQVRRLYIEIHRDPEISHAKVRPELERAIGVFEALGDKAGLARALHMAAMLRMWGGEIARGAAELEQSAQYAREAGDRALEIDALAGLVIAVLSGPEPVAGALRRAEEIEQHSNGARRLEASALRGQAGLHAMLGSFDRARELIASADQIASELGLETIRAAGIARMAGEIELMDGDAVSAERHLRGAYASLERAKDWGHLASVAPLLAEALLAQGRDRDAEPVLELASGWAIEDDNDAQILLHCAWSKLAILRGDATAAEAFARQAVERAERSDDLNGHAGALLRLAEALDLLERNEEASESVRAALEMYEHRGNVAGASRVHRKAQR